ncbi:hypothetical protein ACQ4PT_014962 [Festuca glaucescens]
MTSLYDELEKKLQQPNATPMLLPLEFLKTITCDFSTESELGRGGYGVVYKGVLRSGKIIAVKKLLERLLKHEAFQTEISFLMGIKHHNVVQFVGYCAESRWEAIEQPSGSGRHILAETQERLLCFEYVCNKSLDKHIADRSLDLEWNIRYKIIIGICNGLHFLHEKCCIIHLDLKPENILMDSNMKPKIADFGLSRLFGEQESKVFTDNRVGTRGYMAPEYINQGLITKKADIFSLGVIIIEIVTGRRDYPYFQLDSPESTATSCQHFTDEVLGNWRYKFESSVKSILMEKYSHQVKECITIALKCVDPVMEKRPTLKNVIQVLNAVDQVEASKELPSEMQCMDKSQVLDTNASNEHILHSITKDMSNIKTGDTVGEVKKSKDCLLPTPLWTSSTSSQTHQEAAKEFSEPQQSSDKTSEIISMVDYPSMSGFLIHSIDANQTEPLIATTFYSDVYIWNCDTQASYSLVSQQLECVGSIKIKEGLAGIYYDLLGHTAVRSVKFIARKGWLVVGTNGGLIRVYNYKNKMQETTSFKAGGTVQALAIHPTESFVLSACTTGMKLWDWDQGWFGWKCMQTFEHSEDVRVVAFDPQDHNSFASVSGDCTIKVWSLDSPKSKYTLYGNSGFVFSLDFFTRDGQQYLITGSSDKTAKIWDMHKKECAGTLPHNSAVTLKRILAIGSPSLVEGLACFNESGRVMVAHDRALSMMEIHDEEEQGGSSGPRHRLH